MNQLSPARQATSLFRSLFASDPRAVVSAPGRVNLIGEHTDYNGGPVLPLAIQRRTAVAVASAREWEAVSAVDGVADHFDPDGPMRQQWTDYLAGVVRALRRLAAAPAGARIVVASDLPIGAGLASSAALTVAAAKALSLLVDRRLAPAELAEVAYQAEHDEVGVRCGRMDQTVAAYGRSGTALLFETGSGTICQVPLPGKVWVLETGRSHRLSGGALNARRRECEEALALLRDEGSRITHLADLRPAEFAALATRLPPPLVPRVRHVVSETARTREAATALARKDLAKLGRLLVEGHRSLRDDFQSSCVEADLLVESAVRHGAYGARLTGAGWGGAVVMLAPADAEARIVVQIGEDFSREFGRTPLVWWSRAASGVRREAR